MLTHTKLEDSKNRNMETIKSIDNHPPYKHN
jgi:hypothetical protein